MHNFALQEMYPFARCNNGHVGSIPNPPKEKDDDGDL
jgi:hypothetical protein